MKAMPTQPAAQKTYEMLKKTDPAGAEKYRASMAKQTEELQRRQQTEYPAQTKALEQKVAARYDQDRASFTPEQLAAPAVRVGTPDPRNELTGLQPGPADRALFFKPDPSFPDKNTPDRIQVIAISFSRIPTPRQIERKAWQARVKSTFDFAALAALIK